MVQRQFHVLMPWRPSSYQVPNAAEHDPSSGDGHLMPALVSRVPEHVHIIDSCYCEELYDFQAQGYAGGKKRVPYT
jgi:hypothetical protein